MVLSVNHSVVQHLALDFILVFTPALNRKTTEGLTALQRFDSSRTLFRKRRIGLRHIALSAVAIPTACFIAYACFSTPHGALNTPPQAVQTAAIAVPSPNVIPAQAKPEAMNLKDAFDAVPVPPTYTYSSGGTPGSSPANISSAAAPADNSPGFAHQLASIQTGITKILESSSSSDAATSDGEPGASQKKLSVGKGDTLMDILVRNNIPRVEAYSAIQALSKVYDPRELDPRHPITVFFHQDPSIADPKFSGLRIERDIVNSVVVNRTGDGSFKVNQEAKSVHRGLRAFHGKIDNSLYVDAKAQGIPDGVILELIKLYSFGVDFQRELHGGDTFEVMYEEYMTDDGRVVPNKGNVVYAKLGLSDRMMPLYRYEDRNGDVEYFDPTGQSAKKPLMKTPIDGARISSGFGMRYHPILGYTKMHKGIDFAAPRGTPIYAAGDGVIEKAGHFSSYGNYVRIRHRAGLETAYAHMRGFHAGIRPGSRVKQGTVIGYVGTTGRSTGPHLHYEILINGRQVNPATVKLAGGRTLGGKDLKMFKALVGKRNNDFEKAAQPQGTPNVASSQDLAPAHSN
jgi:murein DD-endopeptidase MepM/ murein hydrolase activator NlpD